MKLFNQPSTTSNTASIKNLHDTTREYLLALNNIRIETESWGLLLLHILMKELDLKTYPAIPNLGLCQPLRKASTLFT